MTLKIGISDAFTGKSCFGHYLLDANFYFVKNFDAVVLIFQPI